MSSWRSANNRRRSKQRRTGPTLTKRVVIAMAGAQWPEICRHLEMIPKFNSRRD